MQRSYNDRINELKINPNEKYNSVNLGLQITVPIFRTKKSALSLSTNYSRSFPKKWNISNQQLTELNATVKSELYSIRGNFYTRLGGFQIGVSVGLHQDKLEVNNELYFSQRLPGFGFQIGYNKPIKFFRNEILIPLPIFKVYKLKDNNIIWGIQVPIYSFRK